MAQEHLDTARLLALYRGETGDLAALEHLASCAECQRAFDDTRWLLLLRQLPELVKAGPHPGEDVLAAYRNHALSPDRLSEVEDHLRACRDCLARYRRGRVAERSAAYSSPSRRLYQSTKQRFRPRPLRRLGTVLVARFGEGLRMIFTPKPQYSSVASERLEHMSLSEVDFSRMPHPASAERRADRLEKKVRDWMPDEEAASAAEVDEDVMACLEAAASRLLSQRVEPPDPRWLRIPAGDVDVLLESGMVEEKPLLNVRLSPRGDEQSAAGVRIRVRRGKHDASEAVTDENGQATLPLDRGTRELIIDLEPPVSFDIEFPG